jgi:uncharacterized membrane protein YkvA (DUF1232 family)
MKSHTAGIQNYYGVLGVRRNAGADEIRRAYIEKIKQWHPDTNAERTAEAEEMTKILNAAYATLNDPVQRKQYDRTLRFTGNRNFGKAVNERAFRSKFKKASPVFKQFSERVRELFDLFKDGIKGTYHLHSVTLGTVGAGLLYFIIPTDMIPDFIPLVGFIDDMAVLTMIINSLKSELKIYQKWKAQHP